MLFVPDNALLFNMVPTKNTKQARLERLAKARRLLDAQGGSSTSIAPRTDGPPSPGGDPELLPKESSPNDGGGPWAFAAATGPQHRAEGCFVLGGYFSGTGGSGYQGMAERMTDWEKLSNVKVSLRYCFKAYHLRFRTSG